MFRIMFGFILFVLFMVLLSMFLAGKNKDFNKFMGNFRN